MGRGSGLTVVEAVEDGWWYTAPLPDGRRVLAFFTDADLPAARIAYDTAQPYRHTVTAPEIHAIVIRKRIRPDQRRVYSRTQFGIEPLRRAGLARRRRCQHQFRPAVGAGIVARSL